MNIKRNCKHCGKPDHMTRLVDAEYGVQDVRHWTCFRCHPELDSSAINNSGMEGGLKAMRSENLGLGDIYCEDFQKDVDEGDQERYADEDTQIELDEEAI
jgi:hypothetical protein